MNIDHTIGNTTITANNSKFPKNTPTQEWGGGEIRTYGNYIRPISNLFGNDRELEHFAISSFVPFGQTGQSAIVSGCEPAITVINSTVYVEIKPGTFINNGVAYHLYPKCEAAARQIEVSSMLTGLSASIFYSTKTKKFSGSVTYNNTTYYAGGTNASVFDTAGELYNAFKAITISGSALTMPAVADFVLTPFLSFVNISTNNKIYFIPSLGITNGTSINNDSTHTVFGTIEAGNPPTTVTTAGSVQITINGAQIRDNTIQNSKIYNTTVQYGSTSCELGSSVALISGLTSLNNITINNPVITGGFKIGHTSNNYSLTVKANYTLGTVCEKDFETAVNDDNKIPTTAALKGYISSYALTTGGAVIHNGRTTFNNNVSVNASQGISGRFTSTNATGASLTVNGASYSRSQVSGTLSNVDGAVVVAGGIVSKDSIFAAGDVLGRNVQSVSNEITKENFSPFTESALEIINNTKLYNYNYKSDPEKSHKIGIKANEAHEYIATEKHDVLDHSNSIALLFKAVQELSEENRKLREELDDIKSRFQ